MVAVSMSCCAGMVCLCKPLSFTTTDAILCVCRCLLSGLPATLLLLRLMSSRHGPWLNKQTWSGEKYGNSISNSAA